MVLDFWVRPKIQTISPTDRPRFVAYVEPATNEGSPDAVKLHGTGPMDRFHLEIDGARGSQYRCVSRALHGMCACAQAEQMSCHGCRRLEAEQEHGNDLAKYSSVWGVWSSSAGQVSDACE